MRYIYKIVPVIFLLFNSCLGLSMDISMRANGSGRIALEYQVPASLENLGRLDGNQNWPVIPVGRQDWERSVSRIPGLRLSSFSSRERNNDYITNVSLDFDNIETLISFLDSSGANVSYSSETLDLILTKNIPSEIDSDLLKLLRASSGNKSIAVSFSCSGAASSITVIDGENNLIANPVKTNVISSGRKVSCTINTSDIFEYAEGFGVRIAW